MHLETPEMRREREDLEQAFRAVLASTEGKRVLFWVLEQCGVYRDAFAGEDTHLTSAMLGEQRVGRRLIDALDHVDPRAYPRLLLEMAEIKVMDRAAAGAAAKESDHNDDDFDGD